MKIKSNIFKDTLVLTYARLITMSTTFIYGMILARALTITEFGLYSQVLIIINFAITFFGLSLPNAINYFLPQSMTRIEKRNNVSAVVAMTTFAGLLSAITIVILSPVISKFFKESLTFYLIIVSLIPCFRIMAMVLDNTLIVVGKARLAAIRRTVISVIQVISISVVWFLNLNLVFFLLFILITDLGVAIYAFFVIKKEINGFEYSLKKIGKYNFKKVLIYSMPLALASIIGVINLNIGKIVVSKLLGTEQLAVYSMVSKELPIAVLSASVSAVLIPRVSYFMKNNEIDKLIKVWNSVVEMSIILTFWIVGILFVSAPEVIKLLYSSKYLSGAGIFRIFAFVLMFRTIYFGLILNGSGHTKVIMYSSLLSLFINFILTIGLFPLLGIYAPAVATLLAIISISFIQLFWSSKLLKCNFKEIFPWKKAFLNLMINGIIGILIINILKQVHIPDEKYIIKIIMVTILWVVIYLSIYYKRFIHLKKVLTTL